MPPLVSPWNEFQGTSTEIQYWWHITIQIRVVLVIGWSKFPMQQDQSEALQYGVSTLVSQTSFHGENQMTAVFSGYVRWYQLCTKELLISYSASSKSGQIQFLTLYLQSLEHHILVIILQRGEVIMSCCHGSKISGWQQTKKLSLQSIQLAGQWGVMAIHPSLPPFSQRMLWADQRSVMVLHHSLPAVSLLV